MKVVNWKVIAIVFIVLFALETLFVVWTTVSYTNELNKMNECLYDICGEYPDGWYEEDVCTCYQYDLFGEYVVAKYEYMK